MQAFKDILFWGVAGFAILFMLLPTVAYVVSMMVSKAYLEQKRQFLQALMKQGLQDRPMTANKVQ